MTGGIHGFTPFPSPPLLRRCDDPLKGKNSKSLLFFPGSFLTPRKPKTDAVKVKKVPEKKHLPLCDTIKLTDDY